MWELRLVILTLLAAAGLGFFAIFLLTSAPT